MTYMRVIYVYQRIFITGSISPQLRPRQLESAHHWNRISFNPNSCGRGLNFSGGSGGGGLGGRDQTKTRKVNKKNFETTPIPLIWRLDPPLVFQKDVPVSSFTWFRVDERPAGCRSLKCKISLDPATRHRSLVLPSKPHPSPKSRMRRLISLARLQSCLRGFDFPVYWLSKIVGFMRFWDFTCVNKMEAMWERWPIITLK